MAEVARRKSTKNGSSAGNGPSFSEQVRVVRRYLSTLDAVRPGRGPKRAAEAIANRLLKIDELLISADPITRLHLTQERIDLDAESIRIAANGEADLADLEAEFVKVAKPYGERCGVTFSAWRQVGVEADVLERAGIVRARKPLPPQSAPPAQPPQSAQAELKLDAPTEPAKPVTKKAPAKKAPAKKTTAAAKKA